MKRYLEIKPVIAKPSKLTCLACGLSNVERSPDSYLYLICNNCAEEFSLTEYGLPLLEGLFVCKDALLLHDGSAYRFPISQCLLSIPTPILWQNGVLLREGRDYVITYGYGEVIPLSRGRIQVSDVINANYYYRNWEENELAGISLPSGGQYILR